MPLPSPAGPRLAAASIAGAGRGVLPAGAGEYLRGPGESRPARAQRGLPAGLGGRRPLVGWGRPGGRGEPEAAAVALGTAGLLGPALADAGRRGCHRAAAGCDCRTPVPAGVPAPGASRHLGVERLL